MPKEQVRRQESRSRVIEGSELAQLLGINPEEFGSVNVKGANGYSVALLTSGRSQTVTLQFSKVVESCELDGVEVACEDEAPVPAPAAAPVNPVSQRVVTRNVREVAQASQPKK